MASEICLEVEKVFESNRVILSLNETFRWELVVPNNFPLVVLHTISIISFHSWCMLEGSVLIQMKRNLLWFIEGQTHLSTSWHAKMSLTVNEPM